MNAISTVEDEVRELVRRRGLDPVADPAAVRRLVDEVITDYDERSLSGTLPQLADRGMAARQVFDAVAGFGPLQQYLDDPTVEEIWINEPTKVFVARRGVHELTTTILTADEVRDLVERMLKSSGRRVDLSTPFVDAMLPDGSPAARRRSRTSPASTGPSTSASSSSARRTSTTSSGSARSPPRPRSSSRRPCRPGSTCWSRAAPRPARRRCSTASPPPSRRGSGSSRARRSSSSRSRCPTWWRCSAASPASRAPARSRCAGWSRRRCGCGPSRIIVGEVRQEESLDLLIALNSRAAGHVHHPCQLARARPSRRCARCRCWPGENVGHAFVVPTVAGCIDLVVHIARRARRSPAVREIVAIPGRVEGDVVETADVFTTRGGQLVRADGFPPHPERFDRAGYDLARLLLAVRAATDGRVRRAAVRARGVPASGGRSRRPQPAATGDASRGATGCADELAQAGHRVGDAGRCSRRPASVSACSSSCVMFVVSRSPAIAFAFAVMAAYGPVALVQFRARQRRCRAARPLAGGRRQPRLRRPRRAVAAGGADPARVCAAPRSCAVPFVRFGEDYRATGRFDECLDRLKAGLADPVGDRIVESLRMAREVGGSDLGQLLRTLSAFLREDARTRAELETRQGWTVNAARLAVAAPWIVLAAAVAASGGGGGLQHRGRRWWSWPSAAVSASSPTGSWCGSVGCPRKSGCCGERGSGWQRLAGAVLGLLGGVGLAAGRHAGARAAPAVPRRPAGALPARRRRARRGCCATQRALTPFPTLERILAPVRRRRRRG